MSKGNGQKFNEHPADRIERERMAEIRRQRESAEAKGVVPPPAPWEPRTVEKSAERNPDGSTREYVTVRIALGPAPSYPDVRARVDGLFVGTKAVTLKRVKRACCYSQNESDKKAVDYILDEIAKALGGKP